MIQGGMRSRYHVALHCLPHAHCIPSPCSEAAKRSTLADMLQVTGSAFFVAAPAIGGCLRSHCNSFSGCGIKRLLVAGPYQCTTAAGVQAGPAAPTPSNHGSVLALLCAVQGSRLLASSARLWVAVLSWRAGKMQWSAAETWNREPVIHTRRVR